MSRASQPGGQTGVCWGPDPEGSGHFFFNKRIILSCFNLSLRTSGWETVTPNLLRQGPEPRTQGDTCPSCSTFVQSGRGRRGSVRCAGAWL